MNSPTANLAFAKSLISEWLATAVGYAWGLPLIFLLIGGGLYLTWISRLLPLRGLGHALRLVTGKFSHAGDSKAKGDISYFQGLMTAMSSTVGLGNIGGVAIAINQGGAGAVFWMWIAAIIGMNTKFFETSMAMIYRGEDHNGQVQGGAMYAIEKIFSKRWRFLAYMFAIFGAIGTLGLYQVNQLAEFMEAQYSFNRSAVGVACALPIAFILYGGIQRLVRTTSVAVPVMCAVYVLASLAIIALNITQVPAIFRSIFVEAFTGSAAFGGAIGVAFIETLKIGVKRGTFSNEAGLGTAPMAHGNVKTSEPISEGLVAMLGPFFDTIVICTMTALVILSSSDVAQQQNAAGVLLTLAAFKQALPGIGEHLLGVAVLLFSFTTMIGMANYSRKCWNYLFRGRLGFGETTFIIFYCVTLLFAANSSLTDVINLIDLSFAMMAIPNMIATIYSAKLVQTQLESYLARNKH